MIYLSLGTARGRRPCGPQGCGWERARLDLGLWRQPRCSVLGGLNLGFFIFFKIMVDCIRNTVFRGLEGIPTFFLRVLLCGIKGTERIYNGDDYLILFNLGY